MSETDSRISPTLHPDTVVSISGYDETTAPFVADVVSAFRDAYVTIGKIHDAAALWRDNQAVTEEGRLLIVGREAEKHQDRLLRKMDSVSRCLAAAIEQNETALSRPLKESAGVGNLNQEVRLHFKGLDRSARSQLINDSFEQSDIATLQALLGAQPFLSGLSLEEHATHVHRFNSTQNPQVVSRLAVMKGAMAKLDRDASKILIEIQKATGASLNRVRGIEAANSAALASLKIDPA